MPDLTVADLASAIYSSGKVFDGLRTGRLDTENFLRSGDLSGVSSRSDLALLEDLRDVARYIIDHHDDPLDTAYVCAVNAQITRSGALHPGQFRSAAQEIGVSTPYGRHQPIPVTDETLGLILEIAARHTQAREQALDLFISLAKAQPFEDGNKRTALFVANSLLIRQPEPELLVIPVDDDDPRPAARFNDLLAQAYIHGKADALKEFLRTDGFMAVTP